jgi:hypothetical protein
MRLHVEAVGTYMLVIENGYILDLENTFYVPSFSRNLISISRLVHLSYNFNFISPELIISYNKVDIGFEYLLNG